MGCGDQYQSFSIFKLLVQRSCRVHSFSRNKGGNRARGEKPSEHRKLGQTKVCPRTVAITQPIRSKSGSHTRSPERPENGIREPFPRQQRYFGGARRIVPKPPNPEAVSPLVQNFRTADGPFAGKPAPTGISQGLRTVISLWERVHPRRGQNRQQKAKASPLIPPNGVSSAPQIIKK